MQIADQFRTGLKQAMNALGGTVTVILRDGTVIPNVAGAVGRRSGLNRAEGATDGIDQARITARFIPEDWDALVSRRPMIGDQIEAAGHKYGITEVVVRTVNNEEVMIVATLSG